MVVRRIVFALALLLAISGRQQLSAYAAEYAPSIFVYPGATNIQSSKRGGSDPLSYQVDAKFPASHVIGWVSSKLHDAGWEPLTYDFLNPSLPSSQVQGWQEFGAGIKTPDLCTQQWLGHWKDQTGNLVTYAFRYKGSCRAADLTHLEVFVGYYPEAVARQMQESVEQYRTKHESK